MRASAEAFRSLHTLAFTVTPEPAEAPVEEHNTIEILLSDPYSKGTQGFALQLAKDADLNQVAKTSSRAFRALDDAVPLNFVPLRVSLLRTVY